MADDRSSPVCGASRAEDVYMGYADREEILSALNELLEAERAGSRVALGSSKSMQLTAYIDLMRLVQRDEANWCAVLTRQILRLGGPPSDRTGAFHEKAMAITDPFDRLSFLNRGQAWVVRRIEELAPRVRDDALHADLREMAANHRENIEAVEAFLKANGSRDSER
jgi:hypothetical protein